MLRRAADSVLAAAYALELAPAEPPGAADRCRRLPSGPGAELPPGGASVRNLGTRPVELGVRRFGPLGAYLYLGRLAPDPPEPPHPPSGRRRPAVAAGRGRPCPAPDLLRALMP